MFDKNFTKTLKIFSTSEEFILFIFLLLLFWTLFDKFLFLESIVKSQSNNIIDNSDLIF